MKIHLLRWASAGRIDLFIPEYRRVSGGSVQIRGGAHCANRPCGLDYYLPEELWVVGPDKIDAVKGCVRDLERAYSAADGKDEFALARARDQVSVNMVEALGRILKGVDRLDHYIARRGELPK